MDLAATVAAGVAVYGGTYLVVGLTEAERRGLSSALARLRGGRAENVQAP